MADLQHETAKRSGGLAAQLAAEVRAGRPERCRLRAYCGCEAARFVCGPNPECPRREDNGPPGCWQCGDPASLPTWLTRLARLAWAPPLWVPCEDYGTCCHAPGGYCGACHGASKVPANVDPAQWVLTVAACGVARAVLADCFGCDHHMGIWCTGHAHAQAAIDAAEQWTRCPCESCANAARVTYSCGNLPRWAGYLLLAVWRPEGAGNEAVMCLGDCAQIIGPDAAREAAARAVLEVV